MIVFDYIEKLINDLSQGNHKNLPEVTFTDRKPDYNFIRNFSVNNLFEQELLNFLKFVILSQKCKAEYIAKKNVIQYGLFHTKEVLYYKQEFTGEFAVLISSSGVHGQCFEMFPTVDSVVLKPSATPSLFYAPV